MHQVAHLGTGEGGQPLPVLAPVPEVELGADPPTARPATGELFLGQNRRNPLARCRLAEGALDLGLGSHHPWCNTNPIPLFSAFSDRTIGLARWTGDPRVAELTIATARTRARVGTKEDGEGSGRTVGNPFQSRASKIGERAAVAFLLRISPRSIGKSLKVQT